MFFGRSSRSKASKSPGFQPTQPAAWGSDGAPKHDFVDTTTYGAVANKVSDVPEGRYLTLPDPRFEAAFAAMAIADGAQSSVVMFVDEEKWASAAQWELFGRLRAAGQAPKQFRKAAREVIRAIHERNKVNALLETAADHTETQEKAFELIENAVLAGASDIHIETRGDHAKILFRIHGERVWQTDIAKGTATEICNTLYMVHADANSKETSWDTDTVKEAAIEHEVREGKNRGMKVQLRFESTPIHPASDKNFQAVIRILIMEAANRPLESVGYTESQIEMIDEMLLGSQGMVLLVGPTNSGKSTSMQAFMQRLFKVRGDTIKAVTVEDPVEYVIENACQMGVPKGRKNLDEGSGIFHRFLKATLRLDPDVVLVGEIRDEESAGRTKDLVLAGRKLLSTLHVYEAFAVFERLKELGVPQSVLYMDGFISGVIYQRLVPVLCPHCAVSLTEAREAGNIPNSLWQRLDRAVEVYNDKGETPIRVRNKGGCTHCNHKGIIGRTPCAELLVPDAVLLGHLRAGDERAARAYWHSCERQNVSGLGVTAVAHAISKMMSGHVDPSDIEAQIGPIIVRRGESGATKAAGDSGPAQGYGFGGGRFGGAPLAGPAEPGRMA